MAGHLSTFSRILSKKVEILESGCWRWKGYKDSLGYGRLIFHRVKYLAHRFFYEKLIGPIPEGYDLHHKCKNTWCVNPDHVKPMSRGLHMSITGSGRKGEKRA